MQSRSYTKIRSALISPATATSYIASQKVIMLTNFGYSTYQRQCRQLGADHFLNKTLALEKILDTILDDTER